MILHIKQININNINQQYISTNINKLYNETKHIDSEVTELIDKYLVDSSSDKNKYEYIEDLNNPKVLTKFNEICSKYSNVYLYRPRNFKPYNCDCYIIYNNEKNTVKYNINNLIDYMYVILNYNLYVINLFKSFKYNININKLRFIDMNQKNELVMFIKYINN